MDHKAQNETVITAIEKAVAQLNETLRNAALSGVTVELQRNARVHSGDGRWADQMQPVILPCKG